MSRLLPALLALAAAGLLVIASLLPEYEAGGVAVTALDPERPAWVATLIGIVVQVGLVTVPALMLLLGSRTAVAGGVLLGAGVLGMSVRIVRILQIIETPDLVTAVGSAVDLLADAATLAAGAIALRSSPGTEREGAAEVPAELTPPPGEAGQVPDRP